MSERADENIDSVALPAPTAWPLLAALGVTLIFAGLVTHVFTTIVGAVLFVVCAVGWFRSVLPVEETEIVPLRPPALRAREIQPVPHTVEHLTPGGPHAHRMRLPVEVHPYSAGVWAGLGGGAAMALVACAFGIIVAGSIWYPINLLAAAALWSLASASVEQLRSFDATALVVATIVHGIMSLLVGFLYAFLLPTMPRRPVFFGGVVAPLLWTGLVWASLGVINPALNARIHWGWFIASQIVFGVVAGLIVARTRRVRTLQALPLAMRIGLEGGMREDDEEKR
ncbi:MAG TPA: hypothetical protein VIS07_11020 [Candidatus Binatia bacterium]